MKEKVRKILKKMVGSNDKRGQLWDTDLQIINDVPSMMFAVIHNNKFNEATNEIMALIEDKK